MSAGDPVPVGIGLLGEGVGTKVGWSASGRVASGQRRRAIWRSKVPLMAKILAQCGQRVMEYGASAATGMALVGRWVRRWLQRRPTVA